MILPATVEGIKKYLKSGFIKGIGQKTALRLINHFEDKTLEVIENYPEKLLDVKGIGTAAADKITGAWKEHHSIRRLIHFLDENGIKTSYGAKIFKLYGQDALDIISSDPFRLVSDFPRTGNFKRLAKVWIRHAAENGFDQISWTPGEVQVERYESALKEMVDKIFWKKTKEGIHIEGRRHGVKVVDTTESEGMLSDAIGKAMEQYMEEKNGEDFVKEGHSGIMLADICPECPECGGTLEYSEGCVLCKLCGYSKCW